MRPITNIPADVAPTMQARVVSVPQGEPPAPPKRGRPARPRPDKVRGYHHKEEANPDGPSEIELGNITRLGEREAVALRAALDDAFHSIAARFDLKYRVDRGQADGDGCDFAIRLDVKTAAKARPPAKVQRPTLAR